MKLVRYDGRCHCGGTVFEYRTAIPPPNWSVRACQCDFCRAHDALSTSDPEGTLAIEARVPGMLRRYRFGLETADFLFCGRCGVYVGAVIDTTAGRFGIVNTHALDPVRETIAQARPANYEGEDIAARVSRRERHWTPVIALREPAHR